MMNHKYIDLRPTAALRMNALDEGIVLRHGSSYDAYGARDIWVFEHNGTYFMHYDAADPDKGWLCALATSKDMKNWEKHGPVLELGDPEEEDSKSASYGVTFIKDEKWHMFYLGTQYTTLPPERIPAIPYLTMKATSDSPYGPWIKQKDVIPFRPLANSYYSATASPGHVIEYNDEYLQFLSVSKVESQADEIPGKIKRTISIARTKDLNGSWKIDDTPILPLSEQIENSSLYYEKFNDTWFLFTNHVGIDKDMEIGEYTDSIWVYWTNDLNIWKTENKAIVLDGNNCTWSKNVIGLPSVIKVGNRLAVMYDGVEGNVITHCHRDIGLAWLELPLQIPK